MCAGRLWISFHVRDLGVIAATVYALALALAAQTSTSTVPAAPKLTPPVLLELVQAEYPPEAWPRDVSPP